MLRMREGCQQAADLGGGRGDILGTGLGDRFRATQGRSGTLKHQVERDSQGAQIQAKRGRKRDASDPPTHHETSW